MPKDFELKVSEFFYSIQGEGVTTGIPSYFLRLADCNLVCGGIECLNIPKGFSANATWRCDTIEVWRKGEYMEFHKLIRLMGGEKMIQKFEEGVHLVITGGEPMLQQKQIMQFIDFIVRNYQIMPFVEIETNGTVELDMRIARYVKQWNVSIKLSNSGMDMNKRIIPGALKSIKRMANVIYKFVISSEDDWIEIEALAPYIIKQNIVLMPAASDQNELKQNLKLVAEIAKQNNVRMCSRLQIETWDKTTGV